VATLKEKEKRGEESYNYQWYEREGEKRIK